MRISAVTVHISAKRTVNYNSIQNSVGFTADLDEDDDPDVVVRQLQCKCRDLLLKRSQGNKETTTEEQA